MLHPQLLLTLLDALVVAFLILPLMMMMVFANNIGQLYNITI